jgi:hypothetical protein
MRPASSLLVFTVACLPLLGQIGSPSIGTARYADGSFHTVQGLPMNMIVADLPLDSAQAASFSDSGGIIAQGGSIRLLGANFSVVGECPIPETPLLSIDGDLTSALAWLPNAHTLLHWTGTQFEAFDVPQGDLEGNVTDLQSAGSKQARLIVQHSDKSVSGVTVSLRTGNLVSSEPLPGVRGYAFGQGFFLIYGSADELVVDNLRGYRRTVPLPASDFSIERMSNNWLHIYSPKLQQHWALHLTQAELQLSMLPGLPEHLRAPILASASKENK